MKEEKSKVNIRQSGGGFIIEITNTPIDQMYAVTKDELKQIVLYGQLILKTNNPSPAIKGEIRIMENKNYKSNQTIDIIKKCGRYPHLIFIKKYFIINI